MATLAFTVKSIAQPSVKTAGRKTKVLRITGDTDIPAAGTGYSRTAAQLGMNVIEACIGGESQDGVYYVSGTPAVGGASIKLRYFNSATAVEAATGENGVDGTITDVLVIGY